MASAPVDEKAGPLTVNTISVPAAHSQNNITPATSGNTTPLGEKGVKETSMEMPRNSNISSPTSVHQLNPFDTDVEAMMTKSTDDLKRKSTSCQRKTNPNCTVWPGQDHWKQKARIAKINNRSCQCMARLSPRNRIIVKIAIAFLIIGIAVGVGVGISKPLGAGIWQPKDSN